MTPARWSAKQYVAFEEERTRPVRDLLNTVPETDALLVADIGCGPGNSTEVLAERFPTATVIGIDSSADMINAARSRLPHIRFDVVDLADWKESGPFDVLLANAVFQWIPNHGVWLTTLARKLRRGGSLAIQMPDNLDEPAHRLMRAVADCGPWADRQGSAAAQRSAVADANSYYDLLQPLCRRIDIWRTTYFHVLKGGAPAIVEWFKGSGLRPYLEPLTAPERERYLSQYLAEIEKVYSPLADGSVLLPFPRIFIVAST